MAVTLDNRMDAGKWQTVWICPQMLYFWFVLCCVGSQDKEVINYSTCIDYGMKNKTAWINLVILFWKIMYHFRYSKTQDCLQLNGANQILVKGVGICNGREYKKFRCKHGNCISFRKDVGKLWEMNLMFIGPCIFLIVE